MGITRTSVVFVVLLAAVSIQYAALASLSVAGVVPNLVLLLTVAAAFSRGLSVAAPVGFIGGILLDLAPPAAHPVGTWALALLVVAVLASRVRPEAQRSPLLALLTVAGCSFVATSVLAFTILISGAQSYSPLALLGIIGIGVLWDVALAPWLLPVMTRGFDRLAGPAELSRP
jgi:rod shape-determining protein MreD